MTGNVIELSEANQELVLVCGECGATTFRIVSTGEFECSVCNERMADDISGVDYSCIESKEVEVCSRHDMGTVDFAFRHVLSKAEIPMTAALVVMNKDGSTHVWSDGYSDSDTEAWFRSRVDDLMEQLK